METPEAVNQANEDPGEPSWSIAVAMLWASDWSDPREDIYTTEDGIAEDLPRRHPAVFATGTREPGEQFP